MIIYIAVIILSTFIILLHDDEQHESRGKASDDGGIPKRKGVWVWNPIMFHQGSIICEVEHGERFSKTLLKNLLKNRNPQKRDDYHGRKRPL